MSIATAILFSGDPKTGESSMDVFRETDEALGDPFHRAQALQQSCEADFPERLWSIGVNDEARELMRDARMKAWGFE